MEEPDPHVVRAAKAGDLSAFEALVRRYQLDVYRFSLHLTRDAPAAEDVTQDTFVRAYRSIGRYRGNSRFSTWLFSIARNCIHDEYRRAARQARLTTKLEAGEASHAAADATSAPEVREALATLPRDLLEPVVMIDLFGFSYREVSQLSGVSEGTIKSRMHRARQQLADLLGPDVREDADEI